MKPCFCGTFAELQKEQFLNYRASGGRETGLKSTARQIVAARDAIHALHLIRRADEPKMLPVASYLCAMLPVLRPVRDASPWMRSRRAEHGRGRPQAARARAAWD
ncbi:hypothetical protein BD413DRAFT_590137 [Trametes elegans]|nr:hypothetical protein BD413DRAFT_590137 [Trametes elegans]